MNRRVIKRQSIATKCIALLLTAAMCFSMGTSAFAAAANTIGNTQQVNQTILEKLKGMYGDNLTQGDILDELKNMGLLDDCGNISVSQSITIDGKPMTLAQVCTMLDDPNVDLSKAVSVEGMKLTLGDLKIMLDIEYELARIKKTYFSEAVPFDQEHEKTFDSLVNQIQKEGLTFTQNSVGLMSPGVTVNHDARIKVTATGTTVTQPVGGFVNLTFSLVDTSGNTISLPYDVSFDWRLLEGSAKAGIHYSDAAASGTITITKGNSSSIPVKINVYGIQSGDLANPNYRWYGDKIFMIQLYNPLNILFDGGTRSVNQEIKVTNNYSWTTYASSSFETGVTYQTSSDALVFPVTISRDAEIREKLTYAAQDISGSLDNTRFQFNPYIKLTSLDGSGHDVTMKPQFKKSDGTEVANAEYRDLGSQTYYTYNSLPDQTMHICGTSETDPKGKQFSARVTGLPSSYVFTNPVYSPAYNAADIEISSYDTAIEIIDTAAPTVLGVTTPAGSYASGQVVPITVEFSEPVDVATARLQLQGEGTALSPAESSGTKSKYATFLYTVPGSPNNALVIGSVSNVKDMAGNSMSDSWPLNGTCTVPGVTMVQDKLLAFTGLSLANPPSGGASYTIKDTIQVRLDVNTAYSLWLDNDYDTAAGHLKTVYLKAGAYTYSLTTTDNGTSYAASIPASNYTSASNLTLPIELYTEGTYANGSFSGGSTVFGMSASAKIAAMVPVTGITLNTASYPENNFIYSTASTSTQLTAAVEPANASFQEIKWSSSDDTVAAIDPDTGAIAPVKTGKVSFTATAQNGGFGAAVTSTTPEFTVSGGGPPAIVFPKGNNAFYTRKNEAVKVAWSQNLIGRTEGASTEFTVEIYPGNFGAAGDVTGTPVYDCKVTDESSCVIPENTLGIISNSTTPAYTVKVSAQNPDNAAAAISAIGYIIVYPQPVKVTFDKLTSYYITDETGSLPIRWNLSDFEPSSGDFELKVIKNQTTVDTAAASSGSYALDISPVNAASLRDVYTVTIRAKNASDSGWSTDSFVLYVYNQNALKILVDGSIKDAAAMDNNNVIKTLYEQQGSEGILALGRDIGLKNIISINYGDYAWGNITDQIKWASSDSSIASVNYRQGSLYENVEKFDYTGYRPSTEFMLVGHSGGSATITATHAATGMKKTLDVDVTTLKNKLYIFNFYPRQETTLTYTNGAGQNRALTTNSNGQIAVYEEKGIGSNISLKSGDSANPYIGTLYRENLISSEGDAGLYELYPVNIFKLREVAKVELFFKNSDGEPYTGTVTYRGAVYKSGKLCADTMEKTGKDLSLGSDGRFTLNLDATKFWTDSSSEQLQPSDKLEFVYEVIFSDSYYPQLITVNGNISVDDVVRFGESVVNLRAVPAGQENKPFVVSQVINYNLLSGRTLDVSTYTGSIGPSNRYPAADLESVAAWWGASRQDGYSLKVEDEYGAVIPGQKSKTILYPFATIAYSKNVTSMSVDTMGLVLGAKKGAALAFYRPDGTLYSRLQSPFTFTNMVGAPEADNKDKGVDSALKELSDSGALKFDPGSMSGVGSSDGVMGMVLQLMDGQDMGSQYMSLLITATKDPMVYRGLITLSAAVGDTGGGAGGPMETKATIEILGAEDDKKVLPNVDELIKKKKTQSDINNAINDAQKKTVSGGVDYGVTVSGYFEVEARYDPQAGKWSMVVTGGGFDLDTLIGYTWTMNHMVGPIPITGEFGLGAKMSLSFRAVKPYGNVPAGVNAADVNDFFTSFRVLLYAKAFGGFGFDYGLIALKIGIFGQVDLGFYNEFLNRSYLETGKVLAASSATLKGTAGLKFVAKFLFASYEKVLASASYGGNLYKTGDYDAIKIWKDNQTMPMPSASQKGKGYRVLMAALTPLAGYSIVSENVALESRDYLDLYNRTWGGANRLRAASISGAPADIQTNSYPYANPVITRDGQILAYLSDSNDKDVNKTRASWAAADGSGGFTDNGAISTPATDLADNNLKLDGTGSFAVAAWEQQGMAITAVGGTLSEADISSMLNSSEIMAGVYNGTTWTTIKLTDNMSPDLSPVVAARGSYALVAWRSVAGSDMGSDPLTYSDVNDTMLCKIYNKNTNTWSGPYCLYNGASGSVKGLAAAMLSNGTAAISYTLDCGTDKTSSAGYETFCALVGTDGGLITDLRLTNDSALDENPQIAAADFGAEGEKFVVGWHNVTAKGVSDIYLAAVNDDGTLHDGFIDSISSVSANSTVAPTANFRFAKGEALDLEDLSLVWVEPSMACDASGNRKVDKDILKAVKFMGDSSGRIYLSGVLDVTAMPDYTLIDHFDAYFPGHNQVGAVMLSSSYTGEVQENNGVYTVDSVCSMKSASAAYVNDIDIQGVGINYDELKNNFRTVIPFTVSNTGVAPVDSVEIKLMPDNQSKVFNNLNLLPNQAVVLPMNYDVPSAQVGIHDVDYTLTANFHNGDIKSKSASLDLDIPDTGIAKVELISDEQGKRVFQATLQNLSDVPLINASAANRKVYVGFYTAPDYTAGTVVEKREITSADDLKLLDESALTMRFTYTVPAVGIPSGGTRLYGKIWVEEKQQDGTYDELIEYYPSNNSKSILFPNPIESNNGNQFLVKVEQENGQSATTANLTVKNLSMTPSTNGNVIAQLLDLNGNVLETNLLATTSGDLLSLAGEESVSRQIVFRQVGAKAAARYFTVDPSAVAARISDITLQGIDMHFDSQTTDYDLTSVNLASTTVMAAAINMEDTVEIKNADGSAVLASGKGAAVYTISLPYGAAPTTLQVSASSPQAGASSKTYTLNITNIRKSSGTVTLNARDNNNGSDTVDVLAENLSSFTPVKWQYIKDGTWSQVFNWNGNQPNRFVLSGAGTYTIAARLLDADGYYMDSNTMTVNVRHPSGSDSSSDSPASSYVSDQNIKTYEDRVTVDFTQGNSILSADQIDRLIELNRDRPIILSGNGYSITFPAGTMHVVPGQTRFDLGVNLNSAGQQDAILELTDGTEITTVSFNHSGDLPGQAEISINVGSRYAGQILYYYYYNPSIGVLEYMQSVLVDEDGYVTVTQSHCSDYVLTNKELDTADRIRIFGQDRYMTAVQIAKTFFSEGAETVILTRGDISADALPAVPLAKKYNGPLLLTPPDSLPEEVLSEIKALGAKKVIIVGGPGAVKTAVEEKLKTNGLQIDRIYGQTLYDTAYEVAKHLEGNTGEAVLVNGNNCVETFADAISISSWAGYNGVPILYVDSSRDELPEATYEALNELKVTRTILIGGDAVVPARLEALVPNPERYGGEDRYGTNTIILKQLQPNPEAVYAATGKDFADALAGAAAAAQSNGWLVLTGAQGLTGEQEELLKGTKENVKEFHCFGGPAVVPQSILKALKTLLGL